MPRLLKNQPISPKPDGNLPRLDPSASGKRRNGDALASLVKSKDYKIHLRIANVTV